MQILGLPKEVWTNLAGMAEETLFEEKLGQCLLGVYPYGRRIYGLDEEPELLCIYLGEITTLLDPTVQSQKHVYDAEKVHFFDLYSWVYLGTHFQNKSILALKELVIPCGTEPIFEDPTLSNIVSLMRAWLTEQNYNISRIRWPEIGSWSHSQETALEFRTYLILDKTSEYLPNLNKDWGEVYNLEDLEEELKKDLTTEAVQKFMKLDRELVQTKKLSYEDAKQYNAFAKKVLYSSLFKEIPEDKTILTNISNEVVNYLRRLI